MINLTEATYIKIVKIWFNNWIHHHQSKVSLNSPANTADSTRQTSAMRALLFNYRHTRGGKSGEISALFLGCFQPVRVFKRQRSSSQQEERKKNQDEDGSDICTAFFCACPNTQVCHWMDCVSVSGNGGELLEQDILAQSVQRDVLPHIQTDGADLDRQRQTLTSVVNRVLCKSTRVNKSQWKFNTDAWYLFVAFT